MYFDELVSSYDESSRERNKFHDLMKKRLREVLLVGSLYDSFVIESDGVLAEQLYGEYFKLNLNLVPRITSAYDEKSALERFRAGRFDLVIIMAGLDFKKPIEIAGRIKEFSPHTPILLLVTNNAVLSVMDGLPSSELSVFERVFVWNGYSKLFLAMMKYVEDEENVDSDTKTGLVRVILLIEDSVRYYSRYLPLLYRIVIEQTQSLIEEEGSPETYKLLRISARPKIILASSYEEAELLFRRYEPYMLALITDLRFPRRGQLEGEAGIDFIKMAKARNPDLPVMVQSSDEGERERVLGLGATFVDKNSDSLAHELTSFFRERLGFGPFEFRSSSGDVIARAHNMTEFMDLLEKVPPESLVLHAGRRHFSAWLLARGEIEFAKLLKTRQVQTFSSAQEIRSFLKDLLVQVRSDKSRGLIPDFEEALCAGPNAVLRLGGGSVGGKGRGLLFIKNLLDNMDFSKYIEGIDFKIPLTAFIGIDEFERFLDSNNLGSFVFNETRPEEIRWRFLSSSLSPELVSKLRRFLSVSRKPLAVRSSGLFEDMLIVPFSGIYDTYLIPNADPDFEKRLAQLEDAVRLTYASLFSSRAREYFENAHYKIEEERMAVVIEEVAGSRRGRYFYPYLSGTAQSFNYYPVSYVKPEDGLCVAALGLGSYVIGGGAAHEFCPVWPKIEVVPPDAARENSQRVFRAIDMERTEPDLSSGEDAALADLPIAEIEGAPHAPLFLSTYDIENDRLVPGLSAKGPRFADLGNILKYNALPLAEALRLLLDLCSRSMGIPVELEYALDIDDETGRASLYLLQLKPFIRNSSEDVDLDAAFEALQGQKSGAGAAAGCSSSGALPFIVSARSMGNGRVDSIADIVYIDPSSFDRSSTAEIAAEIEGFDRSLRAEGRPYLLLGPGRWGSRDPFLGVPVNYSQIAGARVIVEADLPDFRVESSLGSHFFHNVTSLNIGYLTVPANGGPSFVDWDWLASLPVIQRGRRAVWARVPAPLSILMDGRKSRSIVYRPA